MNISAFFAIVEGKESSLSFRTMTFWNVVPPTATPMVIPSDLIKEYIAAARPQSSAGLIA
jgi:hypothetical protein